MPYYYGSVQKRLMNSPSVSKGIFMLASRGQDVAEPVIGRMMADGFSKKEIVRRVGQILEDMLDSQREDTLKDNLIRWKNPRNREAEYDAMYDCVTEAAEILVDCYKLPEAQRAHALGAGRKSGKRTVYDVPYTMDDWHVHSGLEAVPGQQIESEVYHSLMDNSVRNADPRVLIDFGCVRGFRLPDMYEGGKYMTFGQTADGRCYYLGLFPPRRNMEEPIVPVTWDEDFDISVFGGGSTGTRSKPKTKTKGVRR